MPQVNRKNREMNFAILHSIVLAKVSVFPGKLVENPSVIVKRTSISSLSRAWEVGRQPHAFRLAKPARSLASCATGGWSSEPVVRASSSWLSLCLSAGWIAPRGRCCAGRSGHGCGIAAWWSRWPSPTAKTPSGMGSMTIGLSPSLRSALWRWCGTSRRRWCASTAGRCRPGLWLGRGQGAGCVAVMAAGGVPRLGGRSRFVRRMDGSPTARSTCPTPAKRSPRSKGEAGAEMALPGPVHLFARRAHQRGAGPQNPGPPWPRHGRWQDRHRHPRSAPSWAAIA